MESFMKEKFRILLLSANKSKKGKKFMQLTNALFGMLLMILTSCKVYNSQFDCSPSPGGPCTPLTTLEKMIVETPEGYPDIFLGFIPETKCSQTNGQKDLKCCKH